MEMQIHSFISTKKHAQKVSIFGYATKSIPGLEINGLGKYGKSLKEKIIFITRSRQLPIPLKRFVITCDNLNIDEVESIKSLEFPILILYWYLAQLIPLKRLDNCLAVGEISPDGFITISIKKDLLQSASECGLILLSNRCIDSVETISPNELLITIPDLKWKEYRPDLCIPHNQHHFSSNNLLVGQG